MTIPLLPSGSIAAPGIGRIRDKLLRIYFVKNPTILAYEIDDDGFQDGVFLGTDRKVGIGIRTLESSYDEGTTLVFDTTEDWSAPSITPGSRVTFHANVEELYTATSQPDWVTNAGSTGQRLLFSGKIDEAKLSGDASSGYGITYIVRGWIFWANSVPVTLTFANGARLPERIYNADPSDDPAEYKRSIKKSTVAVTGQIYNYAPYGLTGIRGPTATHATGLDINTQSNKMMNAGEIIKDLIASHGLTLKAEGCVPDNWDPYYGTGAKPFVDAELDAMTMVPSKIILADMKFLEAIRTILRYTYPNYSVWIDADKVWHFTAVLDNLKETATKIADVLSPSYWLPSRLGVITLKLAEPVGNGDTRVFGRLLGGTISSKTSDRYTAVRIIGAEVTTTSEASTSNGSLRPVWGNGNEIQRLNLQAGYKNGGLEASSHRHWDRGDANYGIPVYSATQLTATTIKIVFKGYRSELWPHTNDEWNGSTLLLANSLNHVQSGTFIWTDNAEKFTIIDSYNVTDVGDGNPGYAVEIDATGHLTLAASIETEVTTGHQRGAQIQLSDDWGHSTTLAPNQLSVTYRFYELVTTTPGDSINTNPGTPCNARAIIPTVPARANSPAGGYPGFGSGDLVQFGQSLGGTAATMLGRLHSKAGAGGEFWFGGKLIIPFAALRNAQQKHRGDTQSPDFCKRGGAVEAPEVKVVYEKTTESYHEIRVPAGESFAGTAYIISGVQRELIVKVNDFIDASQQTEFENLARMILRSVSDLEPTGDGWQWIDCRRFLSLVDLHFRLGVNFYRPPNIAVGGSAPFSLQHAVVTKITFDFVTDTVTTSLDTRYNPLGSYSYETLANALVSAKRLKSIEEARAKAARARQCAESLQSQRVSGSDLVSPICTDNIVKSTGPGRGRPINVVNCHPTEDLVPTTDGILTPTSADNAAGYSASEVSSTVNLSSGMAPALEPFRDTRGMLFFYDRRGAVLRGDESSLDEGESEHSDVLVDNAFAGWKEMPLRKSHEMGSLALSLLRYLLGADASEPAQTNYNSVAEYDADLGHITLRYDNLVADAYINGMVVISDGPGNKPVLYIGDHTDGLIILKEPAGGFPAAEDIPEGAHIFIVAQRKPIPDDTFASGTRMFKDTNGDWFAVEPDGTIKAVTVSGATNFAPTCTYDAGGSPPVLADVGSGSADPSAEEFAF